MRLFTSSEANHQDIDPHFLNTHSVHIKSNSNTHTNTNTDSNTKVNSNTSTNSNPDFKSDSKSTSNPAQNANPLENNDLLLPLIFLLLYLMEKEENK